MNKEETEAEIFSKYGIAPRQIYQDNDKRESHRRIMILGVTAKDGKASVASCDGQGGHWGKTSWIRFDRLNSKAFTKISD